MKKKTYILRQNLPYLKAGAKYRYNGDRYECYDGTFFTPEYTSDMLPVSVVENNPTWFKEYIEPERIEMNDMIEHGSQMWQEKNWYQIHLTQPIDIKKYYKDIKQAIENVLNTNIGEFDMLAHIPEEKRKRFVEETKIAIEKAEREAFEAGGAYQVVRRSNRDIIGVEPKYPTFESYKQSLNSNTKP